MAARPGCATADCWRRRCTRRQTGYYADLIEEAAALWESLAQNHPFVDGNKRAAFAVMYTFLVINGASLQAGADRPTASSPGCMKPGRLILRILPPGCARW